MKKKHVKQLRQIAQSMPPIEIKKGVDKSIVLGSELIASGILETKDGKRITPEEQYTQSKPAKGIVNHERKMKDLLKKYGPSGVNAYIRAVQEYQKKDIIAK